MRSSPTPSLLLSVAAFLLFFLLGPGCNRERQEKAIGEGYIGVATATLRDRLGAGSSSVGAVKTGERVEILQRRRRWARVRTAAGAEGWLEERHLIAPEIHQRAQQLVRETVTRPSQARARARFTANLHLEPARPSPRLFDLQEGEPCDILEHRAVLRPLPPGAPPPAATPPPLAQKTRKGKAKKPAGPPMEDWLLARGRGKAGWALARFFDMAIPFDVAQYAEGQAITAWQVLSEVPDGAETKPQYIWATSGTVGSPYDFDGIRVFTWNTARDRYETAYRTWNLKGVYPLVVGREKVKGVEVPSFSVTTVDDAGNRATRRFVLLGNFVRRLDQVR